MQLKFRVCWLFSRQELGPWGPGSPVCTIQRCGPGRPGRGWAGLPPSIWPVVREQLSSQLEGGDAECVH